jgi:hypothetical protein
MLFDWIGANAISLLWMVVVVVTAYAIYGAAAFTLVGHIKAISESSKLDEDVLKRRDERRQQHWKERHRHKNPQCVVCEVLEKR